MASVVPLLPVWRVDRLFDYLVAPELAATIAVGSLVRVPFGARRTRAVVARLGHAAPERELSPIAAVLLEAPVAPPPLPRLLDWLARRYGAPRAAAYARAVPPRVRVRIAEPLPLEPAEVEPRLGAYSGGRELAAAIAGGAAGTWSLRAAWGERRGTLIAELVAAAGRGSGAALVAVPEVRLGSRVLEELSRLWPDAARVDSARPERKRAEAWVRLARGHGLGCGGRAAVLAPAPALRLVVVDDEHHPALKEDGGPRYHAARVAIERARLQGALCVLVSPTPPVETAGAVMAGRVRAVEPTRAAERAARPLVEVIEPARERVLSAALHRRISQTLAAGGRVALLAPRRGFARVLWCSSCRRSLRCPRCEAAVAYDAPRGDRAQGRVRCVRCGLSGSAPSSCPACGAVAWRYLGAGSERLERQVARAWPRATVARVDPDAPERDEGEPDIYVTTWLGTKAEMRPPVTFVGVLDADALIRRPDFRAAENAYHALAAMAEWAGPASAGGRLAIQCTEPAHHAVQAVVRADHRFFVRRELELRAELGYPPFSELIEMRAAGPEAADTMARAVDVCRRAGARVVGPVPTAPGARGDLRALAKCEDALPVAEALRDILASAPPAGGLRIDVDPR